MKLIFPFLFCLFVLSAQARQIRTVQDGNWESPSTWYNQIRPDTVNDTIFISHRVSLNSNIILNTNNSLTISTSGSLCGNDSLYMYDNSVLINLGFLGLYYWEQDGHGCRSFNIGSARIDLGNAGGSFNGGVFLDSLACMLVHTGPQTCNYSCKLDTSVFVHINDNIVTFEVDSSGPEYKYYFGDGDSAIFYTTWYQVHQYADTGLYHVIIIGFPCCLPDTLYTTVHITVPPPPPPPPPCVDNFLLVIGPNPANEQLTIIRQFCNNVDVTVRLFTITGQLVYSNHLSTVDANMSVTIPTAILAPACYIADVEAGNKTFRKRIVVLHPND